MAVATQTKLKRGTIKHIESEIYSYWDSMREVKAIRAALIARNPFLDENVGGGRSNLPGDPTGSAAAALVSHARLQELERITGAIRAVYDQLPPEKKRLVELRYWTKPQTRTWEGIAQELNVGRRTAFRWRDEIIHAIAGRLGWR